MENSNRANLPDTQCLESQDIYTDDSIYTNEDPEIWAKLSHMSKTILDAPSLRYNDCWFGRDSPALNRENIDVYIFDSGNCSSKYLERISKLHFKIEREALSSAEKAKGMTNFNPAVITCSGRNGIYINDQKMSVGDRRLLAHKDIIKLTKNCSLFTFLYQNTPSNICQLPLECTKKYFIGKEIGQGGCGVVRLIVNVQTFQKFAMKVIKKVVNALNSNFIAHNAKILNEVNIMKSLSHPHVLSLVDFYESPENVIIIMEYLEGKDMLHRITKFDPTKRRLTEMDAKFFFLQAVRGLKYLHDSFITHRDIKPDNILLQTLSRDAILKISDFGLSKLIASDSMKTVCGTQLYVAPEVFTGIYTNKVDIWSLGCVLFAMLSGSVPFSEDYGPPSVYEQAKAGKFSFGSRAWNSVSKDAKELITSMLKRNPDERPGADEILIHPWLQCDKTKERVNRLYNLNETLMNSSDETELELTMVNVTLAESDRTVMQPPSKRRRIE